MSTCPQCGSPIKVVPAGVSKKPPYKPYGAFEACSNRQCTWKPVTTRGNSNPPYAGQVMAPAPSVAADMLRELQESKAVQLAMNAKLTSVIALLQKMTGGKSAPVQTDVPSEDYQEPEKDEMEPDQETPF